MKGILADIELNSIQSLLILLLYVAYRGENGYKRFKLKSVASISIVFS